MTTSAITLAVTMSTLVIAVLASWMMRRRGGRAAVVPASIDPGRPNLTASIAPLRYSGPVGPTSCLVIANVGDMPVHEVVVSAPSSEDASTVTLWDLALQIDAEHIVVGTIGPQRTALVPAHIRAVTHDPTVLLAGRTGNEPWNLELNIAQPPRSRRARALARRSLHY